MNFKIVKLLFLSALFFSMVLAASMFPTNNNKNVITENFAHKPATNGHPNIILIGDPVGGGVPCGNHTTGNQTG